MTNQYAPDVTFTTNNALLPVIRAAPSGQAHSDGQIADFSTCPNCGESYPEPHARGDLSTTASSVSLYVGELSGMEGSRGAREAEEAQEEEGLAIARRPLTEAGVPSVRRFRYSARRPQRGPVPAACADLPTASRLRGGTARSLARSPTMGGPSSRSRRPP